MSFLVKYFAKYQMTLYLCNIGLATIFAYMNFIDFIDFIGSTVLTNRYKQNTMGRCSSLK